MSSPATTGPPSTGPSMIDWDLAVSLASRLAGEGPRVPRDRAVAAVAELRADADRSTGLVRDFTGLEATDHGAPVLVVDRPGWIQANADGFRRIIDPLADRITSAKPPNGLTRAVGSRITGAEVGGLLGFLAGKVLGQFDPFADPAGRLLLVAPNVVAVEDELGVDPTDFRLWVCLHEETHRVQFTAVPWMTDHLQSLMGEILSSVQTDPAELVGDLVRKLGGRSDGGTGEKPDGSLLDLFASPEQKAVIDRVTGVMSLLEGHADVVMDGVGPGVIPSVAQIRRKFTERRKGVGALDRLLRRLLGLDQKMAQYRDGAVFVRAAVDKVGMEGFNAVWSEPDHLPSKAEILDPALWVARVHG